MPTSRTAKSASDQPGLQVGQKAPDVALSSDDGRTIRLSDFKGKKVVLYFYPKDDTPGCTKEACAFRDAGATLRTRGAVVLGVSADPVESHRRFKEKHRLTFPLLSDANKTVVKAYGVWKEKSLYGRTYLGIERTTFIVDEEGRLARIFPKVRVEGHLDEVLAAL